MNKKVASILNTKDTKLLPVDNELADEINSLGKVMSTTPYDVVSTAIRILKLSLGRRVTVRKPKSDIELEIPTFVQYPTQVTFEGEKNE